ncbi:MAG: hypothetical protein HKP25_14390 [Marinicaulis sp.]|nr:hypothetical protein [Marinicaulis sp.]
MIGETSLNVQTIAMNMFAIISADLIAAWLFGARLSRMMIIMLTVFYAFALSV